MSGDEAGSITRWMGALRDGEREDAARGLWEHYFNRLTHLARAKLRSTRAGPADEEDVALSVLDSVCEGIASGRFPHLDGRDDLWRLLITMTARKAAVQRRREGQLKRGAGRVIGEDQLDAPNSEGARPLDGFAGREPTPEFAALVAEEFRRRLVALSDESLRQVALMRLEGYANDEIASRLGVGLRSVERKVEMIRKRWQSEGGS